MNEYTFKGSNPVNFIFASPIHDSQLLTQLHSERPKLYIILVFWSAIGLRERILFSKSRLFFNQVSLLREANKLVIFVEMGNIEVYPYAGP